MQDVWIMREKSQARDEERLFCFGSIGRKGIVQVKITTAMNRISKIIEDVDYQSLYVEIKTRDDKYILDRQRETIVTGFRGNEKCR